MDTIQIKDKRFTTFIPEEWPMKSIVTFPEATPCS